MTSELETLHELKRTVDATINSVETHQTFPLSDNVLADYRRHFGNFDFIIGNFGVKRIRGGGIDL